MKVTVNELFPEITFSTLKHDQITAKEIIDRKTVFWFLRYIGCPPCHYDLQVAVERYNEIQERGCQIVFAMQSDRQHILNEYSLQDLPFDIICDPTQQIYQQLEILPAENMSLSDDVRAKFMQKIEKVKEKGFTHGDYEGNEQQLPAMFITDEKGTVIYSHYAENIADMMDFDEVLNFIDTQ